LNDSLFLRKTELCSQTSLDSFKEVHMDCDVQFWSLSKSEFLHKSWLKLGNAWFIPGCWWNPCGHVFSHFSVNTLDFSEALSDWSFSFFTNLNFHLLDLLLLCFSQSVNCLRCVTKFGDWKVVFSLSDDFQVVLNVVEEHLSLDHSEFSLNVNSWWFSYWTWEEVSGSISWFYL
jgi:hypothetical protein